MFQSSVRNDVCLLVASNLMSAVPSLGGSTLPTQLASSFQPKVVPPPSQVKVAAWAAAAATSEKSAAPHHPHIWSDSWEPCLSEKRWRRRTVYRAFKLEQLNTNTEKLRCRIALRRQIVQQSVGATKSPRPQEQRSWFCICGTHLVCGTYTTADGYMNFTNRSGLLKKSSFR